ncbi:hypothetical protein [Streptomyces sp. N35]|uniref:hypothetical protein n=1 Tax=Streptomyces sp. N35 TaxID=2795730 RepID=UPI0018F35E2F|nr:hypothetical protein [Streptomyces sp. N35]
MSPRTCARRRIPALVAAGALAFAGCGTQGASGEGKAKPARSDRRAEESNGIEKLSGAEAMQRSREVMADLQSFQRVYTPALPAEAAPGVVARSDLKNGCSITYDVGDTGTMEVRVGERGIYMRGDEKSLTRQAGPEAAKRFRGKWILDSQPDPMAYVQMLKPCDFQGFSLESTQDAPGTTYKKGEPTEIDGIPVLPLEVTEDGKGTQTMYLALRGKPYLVRTSGPESTQDLSHFDEVLTIDLPRDDEVVPLAEVQASLGGEAATS